MPSLLIVDNDAEAYTTELTKRSLTDLVILSPADTAAADECVDQADIVLGEPARVAPLLARAARLRWVQSTFAGVEPLCVEGLRRDYYLTGVKGLFGPLMSEYVFAYILNRERQVLETYANQRNHRWDPLPYRSLTGLTIGIAGLGSIGGHIARTAALFGMRVLGLKRTAGTVAHVEEVFTPHDRQTFLQQLDYLVLALPHTPETDTFITMAELEVMKPGAVVMNVGRGSALDLEALSAALHQGIIAGAVIDVFANEPLPPESPLWETDQLLITPHNAAVSFPEQIAPIFCENYQRFQAGRPLKYVVDFDRGY